MNAIRKLSLASAAALALTSGSASAADYLFNFQFDALVSDRGDFAATNIVYSADNLAPTSLTYVSGSVNGTTSPTLQLGVIGPTQVAYQFEDLSVPSGAIAGMFFSLVPPLAVGTQETATAGRAIRTSSGASYRYTTGRLTITQVAAAVPEPAAWATMIIGFLAVGAAMRRRGRIRTVRIAYS